MLPDAGAAFEREMTCVEAEWLRWLPVAVGEHPLQLGDGRAEVALAGGSLRLSWQAMPPRQIALVRLSRLLVAFRFEQVPDDERRRFMRHFDLHMQRGGG